MVNIAFVTPWFGEHAAGGMETVARQAALRLHEAGFDVEIITTCIRDFHSDWSTNFYRPGLDRFQGLPVRRFAVEKRDKAAFDRLNLLLMQRRPLSAAEEQVFLDEMFRCPTLFDHIAAQQEHTLYFFVPYMFPTTYRGATICPARAAIIPCLHDEGYAYLDIFRRLMPAVRAQLFLTHAERRLAERLYGAPPDQLRAVVGSGVDDDLRGDAHRFRQKFGIDGPFFLYVGRKEAGKNVPQLLDHWLSYAQNASAAPQPRLLLLGKGDLPLPASDAILDLGFVSRQDKADAYAAATALVQPSLNESFSLVLMESWLQQTPVLVHGRSAVTREHVVSANAGLYYDGAAEFAAVAGYLLQHDAIRRKMGQNGRRYVLQNYRWPAIIQQYAQIIAAMQSEAVASP